MHASGKRTETEILREAFQIIGKRNYYKPNAIRLLHQLADKIVNKGKCTVGKVNTSKVINSNTIFKQIGCLSYLSKMNLLTAFIICYMNAVIMYFKNMCFLLFYETYGLFYYTTVLLVIKFYKKAKYNIS